MNTMQLRKLTLTVVAGLLLPLAATAGEVNPGPAMPASERYELSEDAREGLENAYTTFAASQRQTLSLPAELNRIAIGGLQSVAQEFPGNASLPRAELPVLASYQATP